MGGIQYPSGKSIHTCYSVVLDSRHQEEKEFEMPANPKYTEQLRYMRKLIGQRVREERMRQRLTLRQLSNRTNLSIETLDHIEMGKGNCDLFTLAGIAVEFNKPLVSFFQRI